MILKEYNEPTIADFLWWNVEEETWNWLIDTLDLSYSNMPLPYSGLYLAMASAGKDERLSRKVVERNRMDDYELWYQIKNISFDNFYFVFFNKSVNSIIRYKHKGITF